MSSPDLEEALRRSEEFAARLIESSRDCIKILDLQGRLLSMNAHGMAALEICDFGPFVGSPWVEFWEGRDRDHAQTAINQACQGKVGQFTGYFPTTQTKTPAWWNVSVTAILDKDGKPEKLLAVSRNVTELKEAERRLRESQSLLEQKVAERSTDLARTSTALREIVEGVEAKVGEQFFPALVQQLAKALGVEYAFVSEFCADRSKVRTMAFWAGDRFLDNFEYAIAGTPCELVLAGELYHCAERWLSGFRCIKPSWSNSVCRVISRFR